MSIRLLLALLVLLALIAGLLFFVESESRGASTTPASTAREHTEAPRAAESAGLEPVAAEREASRPSVEAAPISVPARAERSHDPAAIVRGIVARRAGLPLDVHSFEAFVLELDAEPSGVLRVAEVQRISGHFPADSATLNVRSPNGLVVARDGRFALDVAPSSTYARRELRVEAIYQGPPWQENVRVELPTAIDGGYDAGTLWLEARGELVRGSVLGAGGKPIQYAWITSSPEGVDTETQENRFGALELTKSAADGSFFVLGETSAATLKLRISEPEHRPAELAGVRIGTRDLRVELEPLGKGSLTAQIELAQADMRRFVVGKLVGGALTEALEARSHDGRLDFRPLDAGTYELQLRLAPLDELVRAIDLLEVSQGQPCADPRLVRIDLASEVVVHEVLLRRANGQPFHWQHVKLERAGGSAFEMISEGDGRLRIPTVGPLPELFIVTRSQKRVPFRHGGIVVVED